MFIIGTHTSRRGRRARERDPETETKMRVHVSGCHTGHGDLRLVRPRSIVLSRPLDLPAPLPLALLATCTLPFPSSSSQFMHLIVNSGLLLLLAFTTSSRMQKLYMFTSRRIRTPPPGQRLDVSMHNSLSLSLLLTHTHATHTRNTQHAHIHTQHTHTGTHAATRASPRLRWREREGCAHAEREKLGPPARSKAIAWPAHPHFLGMIFELEWTSLSLNGGSL